MAYEVDNNRRLFDGFNIDNLRLITGINPEAENVNSIPKIDVIRQIYLNRSFEFTTEVKNRAGMSLFGRAVFWCSRKVYSWGAERVLIKMTKEIVSNYVAARKKDGDDLNSANRAVKNRIVSEILEKTKIAGQPTPWLSQEQVQNCVESATLNKNNYATEEQAIVKETYTGLIDIVKNNIRQRDLPGELFGKIYRNMEENPSKLLEEGAWSRFNELSTDLITQRDKLVRILPGISEEEKNGAANEILRTALSQDARSAQDELSLLVKEKMHQRLQSLLNPVVMPAHFDEATKKNAMLRMSALIAQKSNGLENNLDRLADVVAETNTTIGQLINEISIENHPERCRKETKKISDTYESFLTFLSDERKRAYLERFEREKRALEQLSPVDDQASISEKLKVLDNLLVAVVEEELDVLRQIRDCYNNALNSALDAVVALWNFRLQPVIEMIQKTEKSPECNFSLNEELVLAGKDKGNVLDKASRQLAEVPQKIKIDKIKDLKIKQTVSDRLRSYIDGATTSFGRDFRNFNPKLDVRALYNDALTARNDIVETLLNNQKDKVSNKIREYMKVLTDKTSAEMEAYQTQFSNKLGKLSRSINCNLTDYNSSLKTFDDHISEVSRLRDRIKEALEQRARESQSPVVRQQLEVVVDHPKEPSGSGVAIILNSV